MDEENICGYFPDLKEESEFYLFPDPAKAIELMGASPDDDPEEIQQAYYAGMLEEGFRRSSRFIYRNSCPKCRKCIPLRIDPDQFVPSKSQRHSLRKNQDLKLILTSNPDDMVTPEKIQMYRNYMNTRNDSGISLDEARVHLTGWNGIYIPEGQTEKDLWYKGTVNLDYYLEDTLVGCSILDMAMDRISSAYFYYDVSPETMKRGLGTFSILQEIMLCRKWKMAYYDLGYWISDCRKMKYKTNFKPYEILMDGEWITMTE